MAYVDWAVGSDATGNSPPIKLFKVDPKRKSCFSGVYTRAFYYICILGSIPRWHCIRSMQSTETNAQDMKGLVRGLWNLWDETKSMIEGRNIFAEYVIGFSA